MLEKHADFLRDFRGDTIHPSTLELMHELGLLDEFLKLPHQEGVDALGAQVGTARVTIADFSHLPTHCKFIALMPQWDFLNFLAGHGRRYPGFHLRMRTEATGLIEEGGRVAGVRAKTPEGPSKSRTRSWSALTAAIRPCANAPASRRGRSGAPMDVLWFRLSRRPGDTYETFGHIDPGRVFVMLNRGDYWQCAYVIPKGGIEDRHRRGLRRFRDRVIARRRSCATAIGESRGTTSSC